ncbi:MAG: ribonuclease D, partial [Nocardioidaceae bacterium]|nr:ribonuclease D [Nocardioidaceae bacterium]
MAGPDRSTPDTGPAEEAAEPAPLLALRDGLPPVVDTPEALAEVVAAFGGGTGPVA